MRHHALSLKQPWAALLVHGLKRVEVRRWDTRFRGRLLIHAARQPDERPEAWRHVPPHLAEAAQLCGGIVGAGELHDCKWYTDPAGFAADQLLHLNDPAWFVAGGLYGLCFRSANPLPFHRVRGYVRIFQLELPDPLVSAGSESAAGVATALTRFERIRDTKLARRGAVEPGSE
ncbi:MAG: ASCH domain-containing protein [Gemmataceae bacterium]